VRDVRLQSFSFFSAFNRLIPHSKVFSLCLFFPPFCSACVATSHNYPSPHRFLPVSLFFPSNCGCCPPTVYTSPLLLKHPGHFFFPFSPRSVPEIFFLLFLLFGENSLSWVYLPPPPPPLFSCNLLAVVLYFFFVEFGSDSLFFLFVRTWGLSGPQTFCFIDR